MPGERNAPCTTSSTQRPVAEIAREAQVSRQTLYDWEWPHDQALGLAWGRVGGLKQLAELEAALAKSQRAEHTARDAAAQANREVLLQQIANEYLRSTRETIPETPSARAALLSSVTTAKAAGLSQRELATAIGMSEPTLRRHLSPPPLVTPIPRPGRYPRERKIDDPEIRDAVRALRGENPGWGPQRIAYELGAREKNPIAVGHNTVARILKDLGLSRRYEEKERSKRRIEITCPLPVTASDLKQVPLADGTTVFFMPVVFLVFRSVSEFVGMGRYARERFLGGRPEDARVVRRCLEELDLAALAARPVDELSGGEFRRVLIAQALAQEPRVLLFDEPVQQLDLRHMLEVMEFARAFTRRGGTSGVVVLHDLGIAARYCDRIALLYAGRILAAGTPRDVLTPDHLRTAYGVDAVVRECPETSSIEVIPVTPIE